MLPRLIASLALAGAWLLGQPLDAREASAPRLDESRSLTGRFAGELQTALQLAMARGPDAAIAACRDRAPEIASRLARESGASVGRTSTRLRNPLNAPEPWQRAVLEELAADPAKDEHFEQGAFGARYMKAIRIQPLCLTCHGETLPTEVRARLDRDYPHDQAIGYRQGELRGAFVVTWPPP